MKVLVGFSRTARVKEVSRLENTKLKKHSNILNLVTRSYNAKLIGANIGGFERKMVHIQIEKLLL